MTTKPGALYNGDSCRFVVWAPEKPAMALHMQSPRTEKIEMVKDRNGYFTADVQKIKPGAQYFYQVDGKDQPDPASFSQPEGVHGPSEVVDLGFEWSDTSWRGHPLADYIIYEIHIGAFTQEGTFEAAISRLDDLAALGINAIEIMPIAQFPGKKNWGYDGVFPYAAQNSYGGHVGLQRLVSAAHNKGIAVILDVVYNHLGPEGNCLHAFGPYFTNKYTTPWGEAINFDGDWSDEVRNYFCSNALFWLDNFHIDALRLDAIHQMYDCGAVHFWDYLHEQVSMLGQKNGRQYYLIAESDLNDPRIVKHPEAGGHGFNAQWLDDFHHALFTLIDEKGTERYEDFGRIEQLTKAYTDGFVHSGDYVRFRKRKFGRSSAGIPGNKFIAFIQNHDQVGNTVDGSRLSTTVSFPQLKIAAAAIMLAPYVPMLFMGEEYGEDNPFAYFVDHGDPDLTEAVRQGRRKEFEALWDQEPPDPANDKTFTNSRLNWDKRGLPKNSTLLEWYKTLIALRKTRSALKNYDKNALRVYVLSEKCFALHRWDNDKADQLLAIFNFAGKSTATIPLASGKWHKLLDSADFAHDDREEHFPSSLTTEILDVPANAIAVYTHN